MNRRAYLAAAGAFALAGCTGDGGSGGSPTSEPTMTDSPTDDTPTLDGTTFSRRKECETVDDATVTFDVEALTATVTGCIQGKNGCMQARLADGSYDAEADVLTVGVETFDPTEPGTACTEALVARGYEVTATFRKALPGTVAVVHDTHRGRSDVARVDR
jgi:hypothetical protein